MAQEQIQEQLRKEKKERKRKKKKVLYLDFECLNEEQAVETIHTLRVKLKTIFKEHIGLENAITPVELFYKIFNVNAAEVDIYKRNYWWEVIKKVLRQLRSDETLFVINKGRSLFVLRQQEEADKYKKKLNFNIEKMRRMQVKADRWVYNQSWRNL